MIIIHTRACTYMTQAAKRAARQEKFGFVNPVAEKKALTEQLTAEQAVKKAQRIARFGEISTPRTNDPAAPSSTVSKGKPEGGGGGGRGGRGNRRAGGKGKGGGRGGGRGNNQGGQQQGKRGQSGGGGGGGGATAMLVGGLKASR